MKRLMIALAAATTAMFSFGDFTSTGFEDGASSPYKAGELLSTTNDDNGLVAGAPGFAATWVALPEGDDSENKVLAYGAEGAEAAPTGFGDVGSQYLHVESSSNMLKRNVQPGGDGAAIGDGIYLDTLVKFTPADQPFGESDVETGDKIAISYVGQDPAEVAEGETPISNIVVRAGYVDGSTIVPTNYVMNLPNNADFDVNEWHRLTVRAIANVGSSVAPVGFAIYIDGELLDYDVDQHAGDSAYETDIAGNSTIATYLYNSTKHAFVPSLVSGEYNTATTFASVGFKGTGCIDNIAFSETKPAGLPDEGILVTIESLEGVSSVTVTVGQQTIEGDNGVYTLPTGTAAFNLAVDWDSVNGYTSGTIMQGESSISAGTVNVSDGTTITLKGNRANFAFVDGNGDPVTASTLADALARVGNGETIALAYSYDVTTEGESTVYELSDKEVTLDLHGNTITGGANTDDALFTVNSGAILTVVDSVGGGKIEDDTVYGIFLVDGDVIIGSADATDKGVTIDGILNSGDSGSDITIKRGKFDATSNSLAGEFMWPVDGDSECSAEPDGDGYWVVAPQSTPEPVIPTYVLTIPEVTGASAEVTSNDVVVADLTAIPSNTAVVVTWTLSEGYKLTAGSLTENITMDSNKEAATPTVSAITYATLTITQVANCTIVVSNTTDEVTTGATFDVDDSVELTVYRTPADGYELDNCAATETITMNADRTVTAAVKQSGGSYPSYIDEITDPEKKAAYKEKYDTWATYAGVDVATGEVNEDAFLLNCKPAEVAEAKAAFKFTSISYDATQQKWVATTTTSYNDREFNGTVTVKQYSDVGCTTESETGTFFKAVLQ